MARGDKFPHHCNYFEQEAAARREQIITRKQLSNGCRLSKATDRTPADYEMDMFVPGPKRRRVVSVKAWALFDQCLRETSSLIEELRQ